MNKPFVAYLSVIGGTLDLLAGLYMLGLSLTGFMNYYSLAPFFMWAVIIAGFTMNSILFYSRQASGLRLLRFMILIGSAGTSLAILFPIAYGIIRSNSV